MIQIAKESTAFHHFSDIPFDSVVIISPFFWNFRDDMWQTTHNVALQFAQIVPTFIVEPPTPWNARSEQFYASRFVSRLFGERLRQVAPNLTVFARWTLPGGRFHIVRELYDRRNLHLLRGVLQAEGFRRTLLWHSFPYWSESWIDAVAHTFLAYHCLDYSPRQEEERIIRRANMVFCVSESLVQKHRSVNPHTYILPNGVNFEVFDRHKAATVPRPGDIPTRGRIIGFVGSINCHIDIQLLVKIATRMPDDHLVLIGRTLTNETAPSGEEARALGRLKNLPNVHILGFKPTDQLATYIYHFDVCLTPFLANPFNLECDPLKFYQYLAFGKPIVTTAGVPVAQRYRDICYPAASHDEFLRQVAAALIEPRDSAAYNTRLVLAEAHSWKTIVKQAMDSMQEHLTRRRNRVSIPDVDHASFDSDTRSTRLPS